MAEDGRPARDPDCPQEWSLDAISEGRWSRRLLELQARLSRRVRHFMVIGGLTRRERWKDTPRPERDGSVAIIRIGVSLRCKRR